MKIYSFFLLLIAYCEIFNRITLFSNPYTCISVCDYSQNHFSRNEQNHT